MSNFPFSFEGRDGKREKKRKRKERSPIRNFPPSYFFYEIQKDDG